MGHSSEHGINRITKTLQPQQTWECAQKLIEYQHKSGSKSIFGETSIWYTV